MEKLIAPVFNSVPEALDNLTTVTGIAANNIYSGCDPPFHHHPVYLSVFSDQTVSMEPTEKSVSEPCPGQL
jgi:hypothetical protein